MFLYRIGAYYDVFNNFKRGIMMRLLLSTIGSRGDVQPLVALALQLKTLGQEVHLCVPPDFCDWIERLSLPVTPIGPELRSTGKARPVAALPTPEQRRQMMASTVATQFETITAAAQGCDIIVGATALQIAAPSIAEKMGIPYVFAAYCPIVLPSPHHAPPVLTMRGDAPAPATADYRELWAQDARSWNDMWGPLLNAQRASLDLSPVGDVRSHILTDQPWLAADSTLGPWPDPADQAVFQTGAWILPDARPLSPELEAFLDAGEPPVYFGFGSIRAPQDLSQMTITSARALGRRVIVSRGGPTYHLWMTNPMAWLSVRLTNRRCSNGWPPSSTTAGQALQPPPHEPVYPKSSSPKCTTSTTGPDASSISASASPTPPARPPPTR